MASTVSTEGVAAQSRFDFWHEVICSAFVRLDAEPLHEGSGFRATINSNDLGPVTLSRVEASEHAVHRSKRLIADEPRDELLLSVQLSGTAVVEQHGRQAVLSPGDFALYDATRPYDLTMPSEFEMLVLQFDRGFLLERCPSPDVLTAVRIPSDSPVAASVSAYLRSLEPIACSPTNRAVTRQMATSAVDLVGVALADHLGAGAVPATEKTKHFMRACAHINAFTSDPELTPERIASAIGVSLRHLHQVFREHDVSVNRYVIDRRLARCRSDLLSPQRSVATITEVAMNHGFKSVSHFSRSFSQRYGESPSAVRRRGQEMGNG